MKKISAIFAVSLLLSQAANATGFYVGADALFSNSQHMVKDFSTSSGPKNGDKKDGDRMGYGVNAGFRLDLLTLLASAELFYDHINTSSRNFTSNSGQNNVSDSISVNNRYGAKANVGFAILPRVTPFLTYGLANVNYSNNVISGGSTFSKSELTPLYGVGILIDLPFDISLKASYDYQHINMRSAEANSKIATNLGVARLGVIYNF